jgi:hypothetical protein
MAASHRSPLAAHRSHATLDYVRWTFVALIALGMAALVVGSRYVDALHVCTATLTAKGTIVELCRPYDIADLAPGLLIAGLLLLPDVSELTLPGLGSLKLKVEAQELRSEQVEEQVTRLEQRLTLNSAQSTNVNLIMREAGSNLEARIDEFWADREPDKAAAWKPSAWKPDSHADGDGHIGPAPSARLFEAPQRQVTSREPGEQTAQRSQLRVAESALISQQLLALWSDMDRWIRLGQILEVGPDELWKWLARAPEERGEPPLGDGREGRLLGDLLANLSAEEAQAVTRWVTIFTEEITAVRLARNAVAHLPDSLSLDELQRAFDLAEELQGILREGLRQARET